MTKEEFTEKYPATLQSHKGIIDQMLSEYFSDSDKLIKEMQKETLVIRKNCATNYVNKLLENKGQISRNKNFDTSDESLEIFKELLFEHINNQFRNTMNFLNQPN